MAIIIFVICRSNLTHIYAQGGSGRLSC